MVRIASWVAAAALLIAPNIAQGLTIETLFVAPGDRLPSIGAASVAPTNAVGGGDLATIVRAAADAWEALIDDEHKLRLSFAWYPTGTLSNSAFHVSGASAGQPTREISGSIAFNNDSDGFRMFLDPTPRTPEEFVLFDRSFSDYGSGPIEDARRFRSTDPAANGNNDLYTAALHEIGHALGLSRGGPFAEETTDGDIDLTRGRYAGGAVPTAGSHLVSSGALLSSSPRRVGERRGITQLDLLSVCEISRFNGCRLDLEPAVYAGDLNGDGRTDAADYTLIRDNATLIRDNAVDADPTPGAVTTESVYQVWSASFGDTLTIQKTFDGDYNADGRIDAADYTLWRDGQATADQRTDGDANGVINRGDYAYWLARYHPGRRTIGPRPQEIPEPRQGVLITCVLVVLIGCRIQRSMSY